MIVIQDVRHGEIMGQYKNWDIAVAKLQGLARLPWSAAVHRCACLNWKECKREYEVVEFADAEDYKEIRRLGTLVVSQTGVVFEGEFGQLNKAPNVG